MRDERVGRRPLVVILGAAWGDGRRCVAQLKGSGLDLVLADMDCTNLLRLAGEVGAVGCFCDVSSPESVAMFVAGVVRDHGTPRLVVNAAGTGFVRNLGTVRVSTGFLPLMQIAQRSATIINVFADGTEPSAETGRDLFPYARSAAAHGLIADALGEAAAGSGVEVRSVAPSGLTGALAEALMKLGSTAPLETRRRAG